MSENMYDAWDNGDRHEIRKRFSRLEELTRMARESGLWDKVGFPKELERFAALVAAAEREACEKEAQERIDRLYMMYEQACQQRDALMDQQRAQIEAMRGRMQ